MAIKAAKPGKSKEKTGRNPMTPAMVHRNETQGPEDPSLYLDGDTRPRMDVVHEQTSDRTITQVFPDGTKSS